MRLDEEKKVFFKEGADCPFCGKYGKIYERSLTPRLIGLLTIIYRHELEQKPIDGWLKISDFEKEFKASFDTTEYAKLKLWNLLERMPCKGCFWRVTKTAISFIQGKGKIPKSVLIFDGEALEFSHNLVSYKDMTNNDFDYYLRGEK